ncbi:hypothetical protein Tco_1186065 [Tanacetum coccineum]
MLLTTKVDFQKTKEAKKVQQRASISLRKKCRLNLKNDMPPLDNILFNGTMEYFVGNNDKSILHMFSDGFPSDQGIFHVASSSTSTTPIVERINKLERQIIDGKLTHVDDDGNSLPKVVSMKNVDSDSEVEDVVNENAGKKSPIPHWGFPFLVGDEDGMGTVSTIPRIPGLVAISSGYGTNSLLEQWKVTKRDDDYDPYDDDLYESHDMFENLQGICDDFDMTVRGRKNK